MGAATRGAGPGPAPAASRRRAAPPPPRPPATGCGIVLFAGRQPLPVVSEHVDGPRIVPSSWRLL